MNTDKHPDKMSTKTSTWIRRTAALLILGGLIVGSILLLGILVLPTILPIAAWAGISFGIAGFAGLWLAFDALKVKDSKYDSNAVFKELYSD